MTSTMLRSSLSLLHRLLHQVPKRRPLLPLDSQILARGIVTVAKPLPPNSNQAVEQWDIYASLCLERKPRITKKKTPLEEKYAAFLAEYEFESSKKSDHEVRHESDARLVERIKSGEVDSGNIQTAADFEDKSNTELLKFVPMSRTTEADERNDTKSLSRALDSHLVLVVQQKLGNDYRWMCPQLKLEPGQTLRQVADQILAEVCPNVKAVVLGNAPWGFYRYRYPSGVKNEDGVDVAGAKVFFYKASIVGGEMGNPASKILDVKDYHWLKRNELEEKLLERYTKTISQFLVPEELDSEPEKS